jgi:predicted Zn-dependent protease
MRNSDIKHKEKNYALGGFMEDNSKNEEASHALYAKAKALLYDVIAVCKKNEPINNELYYIEFLSEINLNRIYYAYKVLEELRKNENNQHIVEYAEALYALKTNSKNAVQLANKLINSGEPAINFDLAEFYARNGKLKEAKKILQTLASNSISMPSSKFLLDKLTSSHE